MVLVPYKDPAKANAKRRERYYAQLERERQRSRDYYASTREGRQGTRYDPAVQRGRYQGWRDRNPDALWVQWLKKAHDMAPEQWFAMWEAQAGICYLCEKPLPQN